MEENFIMAKEERPRSQRSLCVTANGINPAVYEGPFEVDFGDLFDVI